MDSGNSGSLSLQSSSGGGGGDDEFDSGCVGGGGEESPLSALLRQPPSVLPGFSGSFYGIQELTTPPQQVSHWSSTTALPAAAPQSSIHVVPAAPASTDQSAAPAQHAAAPSPARGSRKRTRVSRRAPTTVLTTDTSNFRAMVQEFTGIPAPPFAGGGASARSRFGHLFPSRSSGGSPAAAAALSRYLLRPFAQKLPAAAASPYPPPPFVATTSSSADKAIASFTTVTSATAVAASSGTYQLASAPPAVLGMPDHSGGGNYLSFQSPIGGQLEGNARYPAAHPISFDAAGPPSAHQRLPDPAELMGLQHGQMNSEGTMTHMHPRHRHELSGLVGAASVSTADGGCKATSYASGAGSAPSRAGPPPLDRNAQSTTTIAADAATTATTGMRAQGVESSWICTSE